MSYEQAGVIQKLRVTREGLDDWLLPTEIITEGNPLARGKVLWQSEDKRLVNGVWSCEIGSFNWNYTWDETIHLVEGEVTITERGNSNTYVAGDLIYIPAGTDSYWNIRQPVLKVFHARSDNPIDL